MAKMNHVELYDHDVMSNGLVNENVYIALGEMVKERAKQSIDPDWTEADLCLEFFTDFDLKDLTIGDIQAFGCNSCSIAKIVDMRHLYPCHPVPTTPINNFLTLLCLPADHHQPFTRIPSTIYQSLRDMKSFSDSL